MLEDGHSVLCGLLCMCVSRSGLWFLVVSPACPLSLDASSRPFVELALSALIVFAQPNETRKY